MHAEKPGHASQVPSEWVERWTAGIGAGSRVLDVACGKGRHARLLAARGARVLAVDRDAAALDALAGAAGVETRCADLEGGPWPLAGETFDCIVVTNYLHRPLFPHFFAALRPGGRLVYETFMRGNERFGRPSNPAFLLEPGELLDLVRGRLAVLAFEQGEVDRPWPAVVQRMCALQGDPTLFRLPGPAHGAGALG